MRLVSETCITYTVQLLSPPAKRWNAGTLETLGFGSSKAASQQIPKSAEQRINKATSQQTSPAYYNPIQSSASAPNKGPSSTFHLPPPTSHLSTLPPSLQCSRSIRLTPSVPSSHLQSCHPTKSVPRYPPTRNRHRHRHRQAQAGTGTSRTDDLRTRPVPINPDYLHTCLSLPLFPSFLLRLDPFQIARIPIHWPFVYSFSRSFRFVRFVLIWRARPGCSEEGYGRQRQYRRRLPRLARPGDLVHQGILHWFVTCFHFRRGGRRPTALDQREDYLG